MSLELLGNNIPAGWQEVNLMDFCHPKQWKTISTSQLINSGYIVYGANGKIGFYNEYTHERPTLMITCRGATCGNLHVSEPFSYINGNAMALDDLAENQVLQKYLLFALKIRGLEDVISGSAQPQITRQGLSSVKVRLAPFAEQQQIADQLDELLAQVDIIKTRLDTIPKILKRFRQSVLAAAVSGKLTEEWRSQNEYTSVTNIGEKCFEERKLVLKKARKPIKLEDTPKLDLPLTWAWISIDEVCLKITDGTHHSPKSFPSGDYMYVTSKNVREGYINLSNISFVDQKTHAEIYSRCDVVKGDVLYVKDGANTGLSCVNNISEQVSLLSSVGVLRPTKLIAAKYLELYLNSPIGRKLMLDMIGGTAIMRLTLTKIMNSPLSLPPIEEQTEIVTRVEQLFTYADQIEQRVKDAQAKVNHLTQSILAKAFRGELTADWRIQNPDLITGENSAVALLAKIKAERETIATPKKTGKKAKA